MPIDPIPKELFPLVPSLPGVPALLRSGAQIFDAITFNAFGASEALGDIIGISPIKWGVFDSDGNPITTWDSFNALRYRNTSDVSNYPIEGGTFAAYNKVDLPFDVQVVLIRGGSEADRAQFIADVEAMRASLTLCTVVTPEFTFEDVNIIAFDYVRQQGDGANQIVGTLGCTQIRSTASADFNDTTDPESQDVKDLGQVQTVDDPTIDVTGVA